MICEVGSQIVLRGVDLANIALGMHCVCELPYLSLVCNAIEFSYALIRTSISSISAVGFFHSSICMPSISRYISHERCYLLAQMRFDNYHHLRFPVCSTRQLILLQHPAPMCEELSGLWYIASWQRFDLQLKTFTESQMQEK